MVKTGKLYAIYGPMFAGKSTSLLQYKRRAELAGKRTILFKPVIDDRYSKKEVVTHDGLASEAVIVTSSMDIYNMIYESRARQYTDVFIDEAQFLDDKLIHVVNSLILDGMNVYVAGLNTDFRGVPFPTMEPIIASAHHPVRLMAVCKKCGSYEATMTQRLIDGKPAKLTDPVIVVGGEETYEARCLDCFELGGSQSGENVIGA